MGKSQRAALTVDVEAGTVAISKRGGGSPEETIPQDRSKRLLTPFTDSGLPWHKPDGLQTWLHPHPHSLLAPVAGRGCHCCPLHTPCSVLQLIKYQSMQSKVRLVYNREMQKSLSRDFVFTSARVRGTGWASCLPWGDGEPLWSTASQLRAEITPANWLPGLTSS